MTYDANLSHPGRLAISSGWLMANAICHPNNLWCHLPSSGWLKSLTVHGQCSMSSGWHTITTSHQDDLAEVVSHLDELQLIHYVLQLTYAPTLKSSRWHSEIWVNHLVDLVQYDVPFIWHALLTEVIRVTYLQVTSHPDDLYPMQHVTRTTKICVKWTSL